MLLHLNCLGCRVICLIQHHKRARLHEAPSAPCKCVNMHLSILTNPWAAGLPLQAELEVAPQPSPTPTAAPAAAAAAAEREPGPSAEPQQQQQKQQPRLPSPEVPDGEQGRQQEELQRVEQWKADALRRAHEDEILAQAAKIEAANRRGRVAACPEPKRTKVDSRSQTGLGWATNCSSCWQCSEQ